MSDTKALREALEWYGQMAKQMGAACLRQDNQAMLHLMKELSIDYGKRAKDALNEPQP